MTADPEFVPEADLPSALPVDDGQADRNERTVLGGAHRDQGSFVVSDPSLRLYESQSAPRVEDGVYAPGTAPIMLAASSQARLIPNVGDSAIFFLLAVMVMALGEVLLLYATRSLHLFGKASLGKIASDARFSIPSQAVEYLTIFCLAAMLFSILWPLPFLRGIRWNAHAVSGRLRWLAATGILLGFAVGFGGDFLPMPKDAPIVQDMMNTSSGAWLMFFFSFTGAPLMEELAFRGFLLPSLLNTFRWSTTRGWLPTNALRWVGVPLAVLLTSCCFAMLHGPQVSHSWGPVFLIGVVSVVLCVVRLRLDSVLASAVVHAAYNFTLFAGILVTTDGFRHLDKLKS